MSTEKYKKFFKRLYDDGQIPEDLYIRLQAEIVKDGKMTKRVYGVFLKELERRRMFDVDGTPYDTKNSAVTDGNYPFLRKQTAVGKFFHAIWIGFVKVMCGLLCGIYYGAWRVRGKEHFKGLKGCITTSNHIDYLDTCLTVRVTGSKKFCVIIAPHNCKNDFFGWAYKKTGAVPLQSAPSGFKPFCEALESERDRGAAIHFYAEQSMWHFYDKPRPYKDGAFFYADKLDIPVVPVLYCVREPKGLRKLLHLPKITMAAGEPQYVNRDIPGRLRKAELCERVERETARLYEDITGKKAEYLPCVPEFIETDNTNKAT